MTDIESSPLTPEQERILSEAEDASKKSDLSLADFGKQLITLNSAMIAAYVAALKLIGPSPSLYYALPIIAFLFSLILGLIGLYPKRITLETTNAEDIADAHKRGLNRWHRLLRWAMCSYVLGIVLGLAFILLLHGTA